MTNQRKGTSTIGKFGDPLLAISPRNARRKKERKLRKELGSEFTKADIKHIAETYDNDRLQF